MAEVENSFGSNLCRCTGYRAIIDTFRSFAHDANYTLKDRLKDIEVFNRIYLLNFHKLIELTGFFLRMLITSSRVGIARLRNVPEDAKIWR